MAADQAGDQLLSLVAAAERRRSGGGAATLTLGDVVNKAGGAARSGLGVVMCG